ncbi:MAG: hypothetical protein LKJ44_01455 [Bifidobacteriaceae bacterium]|nr:hypothetical protein [Bifidobacteriaceae bacterium]
MPSRGVSQALRLALIALTIVALGGCGQPSASSQSVRLDDVVAAIPLYELADSDKDRSQMALIHSDGSYELLQGSAMFSQFAVWTKSGLFYQDSTKDYFIGADPTDTKVTENPKTDFEYGSIALNKDRALTVYNSGLQDRFDGQLQISHADGTHSASTKYSTNESGGWGVSLALCGTTPYILSSGNLDPDSPAEDSALLATAGTGATPRYRLIQQVDFDDDDFPASQYALLGDHPYVDSYNGGSIPCRNDTLVFPVRAMRDSVEHTETGVLAVMKWNVKTGRHSLTVLKDADGTIPHYTGKEWEGLASLADTGALQGDDLVFYNNYTGRILSADITTGTLHTIGAPTLTGSTNPYNGNITVRTSPTHLYETIIPLSDTAGTRSFIDVYDRRTERLVKTLTIDDGFTTYEQTDTVQSGDPALNPTEPLFNHMTTAR